MALRQRLSAPVATRSLTVTLILLAILGPFSVSAQSRWQTNLDSLALEAVRADLQLAAARANREFWSKWQKSDRSIVKLFHRDPAFAEAVRFRDPQQLVDSYPMLLHALISNARWLHSLGRHNDGGRVRRVAARLATFAAQDESLWSTLILNTISRFLLAGWRDVDDPLSTLEFQVHQALSNAEQLRVRVQGGAPVERIPRWRAALAAALSYPLPPSWPLRVATILLPVSADMVLAPLLLPGPPVTEASTTAVHNPLLDDLTYALNLPFGLAPPGTPVTRHLSQLPPDMPRGDALLPGAGDGAEALAAAATGRFARVTVVEHSPLAVLRTKRLAKRLDKWLESLGVLVQIDATVADVIDYQIAPESCSLIMAIHLLEYLSRSERLQFYDGLQAALLPRGQIVFAVHLAEGPRYESLLSEFANIRNDATPDGVRITLSQMVPARPDAVQVQTFFHEEPLRTELEEAFPASRFDTRSTLDKTPAGFAEYTIVLTRK